MVNISISGLMITTKASSDPIQLQVNLSIYAFRNKILPSKPLDGVHRSLHLLVEELLTGLFIFGR